MKLTDLEPEWCIVGREPKSIGHSPSLTITNAQGILFLDPHEFAKHGGAHGTSSVLCWFKDRGVPADEEPLPGRWAVSGTCFADLTLHPSVDLTCGGKHPGRWHGWVKAGEVT